MSRLILFRHAKAVRKASGGDKHRGLEKRGRAAAERMGRWLLEHELVPELALVSDARRTRETFEHATKAFEPQLAWRLEPKIYEASADALLKLLQATNAKIGCLLIIGHNPGLAELAAGLAGGGDRSALTRLRLKFPTAAIAELEFEGNWSDLVWGGARLANFVTPAALEADLEDD